MFRLFGFSGVLMLSFQALITVKKIGSHKEQFSEIEKNRLSTLLQAMFERGVQEIENTSMVEDIIYQFRMNEPELIIPKKKDIDELIIPLPSLRAAIIEEMKKRQEMPLTELLELIHQVYHEENN